MLRSNSVAFVVIHGGDLVSERDARDALSSDGSAEVYHGSAKWHGDLIGEASCSDGCSDGRRRVLSR